MTTTPETTRITSTSTADQQLKAKHRALWASGDYPAVATEVIPATGPRLVAAAGVRAGQRVLDVAAGSGNAAIPAALAGADVLATDLTPELFEAGRRDAARRGAELTWQEADAEHLPLPDASFDTVLSCVGVMFAPYHQQAADELVRVCRPGGTIALLSWTPEGFIGQLFATLKPYAPPPPPGASPAPLWGSEEHVRGLLGDRVDDVTAVREDLVVERFSGPEELWTFFRDFYGPVGAVYRNVGDDAERRAALDADLTALAERFADGPDFTMRWEYLILTARRTG
jgi:SAM-dependent methyltransferase